MIRILAPRDRAFATQGHIFVLWMAVATILLTAVAILFIRNQTRTIERLASAADAFGQRHRRPGLQAARRARGAPGGPRLPGHEVAHPAPYRPAHRPAGLGQPRPAHAPDPPEAGTRPGRAQPAQRRDEARPRRDGAHDRRVPGLRPRRGRRGRRGRPLRTADRGGQRGRRAAGAQVDASTADPDADRHACGPTP